MSRQSDVAIAALVRISTLIGPVTRKDSLNATVLKICDDTLEAIRTFPPEPEVVIDAKALASAMKKMLPAKLLREVVDHLDPVSAFVRALREGEDG